MINNVVFMFFSIDEKAPYEQGENHTYHICSVGVVGSREIDSS